MANVSGCLRGARFLAPLFLVTGPLAWLGFAAPPAGAVTVIAVTTNVDSGAGSLRAAMTAALNTADNVEIDVNAGLGSITLGSTLPPYNGGGGTHSLTLKGNGVTVVGLSGTNVFDTTPGGVGGMSFDDVNISGGDFGINANAGATITVSNSTIKGPTTDGIDSGSGAISVSNSTISGAGNDAVDTGNGPITVNSSELFNNANDGIDTGTSTITVSRSTVNGNANDGIDSGSSATINVTNSTVADNLNAGIDTGASTINLAYDTINNSGSGFAQIDSGGGTLTSFGTVITQAGGGNPNCAFTGTKTSQGYNYSDDATCGFTQATDKQGAANPMLGTLGAHGGTGLTMVPKTGSPLIDAIPAASCQTGLAAGIVTDERGITRPQGSGCDIGAVEVAVAVPTTNGYSEVASDGGVFSFHAPFYGSLGGVHLAAPIVGMAVDPATGGYWLVGTDGGVFSFHAPFYGSLGGVHLAAPIVGMAVDPATGGYWLVGADGGMFSFHAPFHGSLGGVHLAAPIVGMAVDPATGGYLLVARDGGVFCFDAPFYGSLGGVHLAAPIVGMAVDPATGGYWLVASDGGVFSFHAPFHGSLGGVHLAAPIVGMAVDPATGGYLLVARDGGVFCFDAPFYGSLGGVHLAAPVVGVATSG